MKKIIVIIIAVIIVIFIIFKAIATEPPQFLPTATLSEPNQPQITLKGIITGSDGSGTSTKGLNNGSKGIAVKSLDFKFTGYGPAKEHTGTFSDIKYDFTLANTGSSTGLIQSGTVVINTSTVSTGINLLDTDLCSKNFFECPKNPIINFSLKSVVVDPKTGSGTASGELIFKGKTKAISFPITFARANGDAGKLNAGTYTADFRVNMKDFYSFPAVNDEVRIRFTVVTG